MPFKRIFMEYYLHRYFVLYAELSEYRLISDGSRVDFDTVKDGC